MHAREKGEPTGRKGKGKEQRSQERNRGSQQPSKGRAQGRGHGRHTASTTPHQSTREGGTRGTGERRHHAPRHAPQVASGPRQPGQRAGSRGGGAPEPRRPPPAPWRAAPHRAGEPRGQCRAPTLAQPRPQHVGSGPGQPARRAGSWGRGSALPQTPLTTANGTPPGDALPPPPQCATPSGKNARCGAPAGSPRPHRPHPGQTGRGTPAARPRGRAAGGGTAPDTRRPSQRWQATPPEDGPRPPPRHAAPTGHASQGDSAGPPHPYTRSYSTWVADPDSPPGGRAVRGGERLTSDAPHNGERHPPQGRPSANPKASNAGPQGRTLWGQCWVPTPAPTAPRTHGSRNPCCPPQRTSGREGTAPDTRRPSQRWQANPPQGPAPHHPRGTQPPQGMQAKGNVLGTHTSTPAPTARGWRTLTARPEGRQSGEGERLTSDAPHNGERHPPRGRPSASPTASNAGPQGRTLLGRCWVPTPATTAPRTHGSRNPGCPLQRTGGRGRDSA